LNYPDTPGGLEKLAKDIFKAQKENNGAQAEILLQSMVLPNARAWYNEVFGSRAAENDGARYEAGWRTAPPQLASFFLNAYQEHMNGVSVVRFDSSCDDNAGESAFGILHERLEPVPFYELRLVNGDHFRRLFPIVYSEGGFRFVLAPDMTTFLQSPPRKLPSDVPSEADKKPDAQHLASRIRIGGNVAAAKIVHKEVPHYPETARQEHVEGTVRFHVIIGKDGAVRELHVMEGYCSLSEAALEAVRKWRYQPTLLNGQPVEVDTTIDVLFHLNR